MERRWVRREGGEKDVMEWPGKGGVDGRDGHFDVSQTEMEKEGK